MEGVLQGRHEQRALGVERDVKAHCDQGFEGPVQSPLADLVRRR